MTRYAVRGGLAARRGALPLACVALLAALGCGPASGTAETAAAAAEPESEEAEGSVLVQTSTIDLGSVTEAISANGQVEFDPTRVRTIPFPAAGEVVDVRVVPGERVHKGDLIESLGPLPSGSLDTQRVRMETDYARRDLERITRLREENLATNADVQNAEKALAASRAELRNMGGDTSRRSRELRAPADGVIAQIEVTPGSLVQPGQTAFTLAPPDALVVRVGFDPEDAARLQPGLPVRLQPLFARDPGEPVSAELTRLQSMVDPATQRVEGMIRVTDPGVRLFAGERLRVSVAPGSSQDALVLPRAALTEREGAEGVFVVEDEHAHWRPVSIGLRGEDDVEARSGLKAGDVVVIAGHSSLADDTEVRVDEETDVASPGPDEGAEAKEGAEAEDGAEAKGEPEDEKGSGAAKDHPADAPEADDAPEAAAAPASKEAARPE